MSRSNKFPLSGLLYSVKRHIT